MLNSFGERLEWVRLRACVGKSSILIIEVVIMTFEGFGYFLILAYVEQVLIVVNSLLDFLFVHSLLPFEVRPSYYPESNKSGYRVKVGCHDSHKSIKCQHHNLFKLKLMQFVVKHVDNNNKQNKLDDPYQIIEYFGLVLSGKITHDMQDYLNTE